MHSVMDRTRTPRGGHLFLGGSVRGGHSFLGRRVRWTMLPAARNNCPAGQLLGGTRIPITPAQNPKLMQRACK